MTTEESIIAAGWEPISFPSFNYKAYGHYDFEGFLFISYDIGLISYGNSPATGITPGANPFKGIVGGVVEGE